MGVNAARAGPFRRPFASPIPPPLARYRRPVYDDGRTKERGMAFWKNLFAGLGAGAGDAPQASAPEEYNGFTIRAAPFKSEGHYQTAGVIEKEIAGERKEHRFVRADTHVAFEDAVTFSLAKARQLIDLQGERLFR
jgi:hypothetical protein